MRLAALAIALFARSLSPTTPSRAPGSGGPAAVAARLGHTDRLSDRRAADLQLRDDQLTQLKDIDRSLAARDAEIDTQLRQIGSAPKRKSRRPEGDEERARSRRATRTPRAPPSQTNADSQKLRKIRDGNDRDAVKKALALLDPQPARRRRRRSWPTTTSRCPGDAKKNDEPPPMTASRCPASSRRAPYRNSRRAPAQRRSATPRGTRCRLCAPCATQLLSFRPRGRACERTNPRPSSSRRRHRRRRRLHRPSRRSSRGEAVRRRARAELRKLDRRRVGRRVDERDRHHATSTKRRRRRPRGAEHRHHAS